jgi:hypothetical protein
VLLFYNNNKYHDRHTKLKTYNAAKIITKRAAIFALTGEVEHV